MKKDTFYVKLLGELEISYKGKSISEKSSKAKKIWNLLAYIVMHKNRLLLQTDLIDTIWTEDENINPKSSLKTSMYRIRAMLSELAVDNEEFIISSRGAYSWNTEIECNVDAVEFERLCIESEKKGLSNEEQITILKQAIDMYEGDFLKRFASDLWVIPLITHFHSLYVDKIKNLLMLLEKEKRYEDMEQYALNSIRIESYDEKIHCYLVKAFTKQGNNTAAIAHYNKATKILLANLGVQPSAELRNLYLDVLKTVPT